MVEIERWGPEEGVVGCFEAGCSDGPFISLGLDGAVVCPRCCEGRQRGQCMVVEGVQSAVVSSTALTSPIVRLGLVVESIFVVAKRCQDKVDTFRDVSPVVCQKVVVSGEDRVVVDGNQAPSMICVTLSTTTKRGCGWSSKWKTASGRILIVEQGLERVSVGGETIRAKRKESRHSLQSEIARPHCPVSLCTIK